MRTIGMMLSLSISALIFAVVIGRVQITPEYYDAFLISVKLAFTIFTAACFGGIFASLARGKMHSGQGAGVRNQGQQRNRPLREQFRCLSKRKRNDSQSWQASTASYLAGSGADDRRR